MSEKVQIYKTQEAISNDKVPLIKAFAFVSGVPYGQHQKTGDIYWWSKTEKQWLIYQMNLDS